MEQNKCKRCLTEEISARTQQNIARLIEKIPDGEKAEKEKYERRIKSCLECRYLNMATCMLCGCLVELRAARKDMGCPDKNKGWI